MHCRNKEVQKAKLSLSELRNISVFLDRECLPALPATINDSLKQWEAGRSLLLVWALLFLDVFFLFLIFLA